ncbi:uncharacterized protein LOC107627689 [Arachis ipaensis]|uniref:Reverse transcriptase zinc-binding domain-containing protein n=1 Tax=Arachis hypogaea TaxID=3818 RepID=A0A445AKM9_ARAHY|nr:uncharacterized protein LOC107627689 [Arachis ipaensis]XP_025636303.1 uncharacterized protein LOC112730433 [Arachis hypogaea]RYR26958.1 hypothetical protein Ahy_B02g061286 [Arachis hypogaea]
MAHEGLPVNQKLHSRIASSNPMCIHCQMEEESVGHCIFDCPDSMEAWRLAELEVPAQQMKPWKRWLEFIQATSLRSHNYSSDIELAANLCWQIWKARNELVFNKDRRIPWMCVEVARRSMQRR